jgi:phospholipid-transporting ATPase
VSGFTLCRNSDLIEEMGQVEFIFSDKTGTLTLNQMVFKECCVNGKIFTSKEQFKAQILKKKFESKEDQKTTEMLHEFCQHLSLCHSVLVDVDKEAGTRNFLASSPDETALIEGAKWGGYAFAARNSQYVGIENAHSKGKEIYELLHEFPFDSDRKRMSVILRKRNDKNIVLLSKGADSVMFPRIGGLSPKELNEADDQVYAFATKGYRVLVIAKRVVDESTYARWLQKYDEVRLTFSDNKDARLSELYDELEQELTYLGSTAIEDRLQEEVPETIKYLMDANVKIWVLTGDK